MSSARFAAVLKSAKVRPTDRIWFARWVDAYRRFRGVGPNNSILVDRDSLIAFLRCEKDKGRKPWQRLQIVKAVECYRNMVLRTAEPDLVDVRDVLTRAAEQQCRTESHLHEIDVVGVIDPNEPEPIRGLRGELRRLHRARNNQTPKF